MIEDPEIGRICGQAFCAACQETWGSENRTRCNLHLEGRPPVICLPASSPNPATNAAPALPEAQVVLVAPPHQQYSSASSSSSNSSFSSGNCTGHSFDKKEWVLREHKVPMPHQGDANTASMQTTASKWSDGGP